MSNSKPKLSLASGREPFGKVTSLEQIPSVLFELLCLSREIEDPKGKQIAGLIDGVITVALADPEAWLKIEQMAENGYRVAFSRLEPETF
jgi:hypothetical protein